MPIQDSRAEYAARMHRVQAHIDDHLDEPLDLASLAQVAHFSEFHFHRLFAARMGETLGDHVRRRRLEVAAQRLIAQPRLSVLAVALSVGWGSGEAFARAFRIRFGRPPSQWRIDRWQGRVERKSGQAESKVDQASRPTNVEHERSFNSLEPIVQTSWNVEQIDRAPTRIAYRRHLGPYGKSINVFWMKEVVPWFAAHGLEDRARYGISHDDPEITDPSRCRYDAGVEVDDAFAPGAGVFTTVVPGGRYASLKFEGDPTTIDDAWKHLLRDWLPESGLQLDGRPCFEHYPERARYDSASGRFTCEIVVPVARL